MRQSARGCTNISRNTAFYGREKRGRDPTGLSCEAGQLDSGFFFSLLVSFSVCSCGAFCSMKIYWKVLPSPWWMPSAAWEAFQRLSADNAWLTGTLLNLWTVHALQGRLGKQSGSAWANAPLPFICERLGQTEGKRREGGEGEARHTEEAKEEGKREGKPSGKCGSAQALAAHLLVEENPWAHDELEDVLQGFYGFVELLIDSWLFSTGHVGP